MTSLGDRMKLYESGYDLTMISRVPIIIRIDGKGFSKYTKQIKAVKPFDDELAGLMSKTMVETASRIEGCMFGFTQSDEISFVLRNDQSLESTPWFNNRIQKIASITASMASAIFNTNKPSDAPLAFFDARVFAVPNIDEAINCLIWRQQDATKNSVNCATYYELGKIKGKKTAQKIMHGLNQKQQQELLYKETGINWNDYPTKYKRGIGCYRREYFFTEDVNYFRRTQWEIDESLPIFTQDKEFLKNIISKGVG